MFIDARCSDMKRLLFLTFLLGCAVSFIASGRLTVRLILGGAAAWVVVPMCEAASFAIVRRRARRRSSFARDLDRFAAGDWPWALWLIVMSGLVSFLTPMQADAWFSTWTAWMSIDLTACAAALSTASIDVRFFQDVFGRTRADAIRDVLVQRAISWSAMAVYLAGFAGWPLVVDWLGLAGPA